MPDPNAETIPITTNIALRRRYVFRGMLLLNTPLHIGGGDSAMGATDSPVIRTATRQPYIPGSSLKGAFRSTVEKLAATLGLPNSEKDTIDARAGFLKTFNEKLKTLKDETEADGGNWDDAETLALVQTEFPATSMLFGSTYCASRILFSDLYLSAQQESVIERRDGVAIDRDSERAMDRLKYDYEVVASSLAFDCEIQLEDPTDLDLALTCLGVSEMVSGHMPLGGKRSSGLGRCQLTQLQVHALDLSVANITERSRRLRGYLLGKTLAEKMPALADAQAFLQENIKRLLG